MEVHFGLERPRVCRRHRLVVNQIRQYKRQDQQADRRSCESQSNDQFKKSKVMRVNARNDQRIDVSGNQEDEVEEFVYLGALLDK